MKNLFLGLIAIAFFTIFSCTNQEDVTVNNSSQLSRISSDNINYAKELYEIMILTNDYNNYKSSRTSFVNDMNGNIILLRTKTEYMVWISENLHLTNFTSVSDFERSLDEMVQKQSILRQNNSKLYEFLDVADADEYLVIIESNLGKIIAPSSSSSCSGGCMDSCEHTLDNIENGTALNQALYGGNPFTDAIIDAMYWSMFQSAVYDLNSCLAGC